MRMLEYIAEIQRQFIEVYGFPKGENGCPQNVPDGEYPMEIEGKTDYVRIKNDSISCCNWTPGGGGKTPACVKQYGRTCGAAGLRLYQWCNDCLDEFRRRAAAVENGARESHAGPRSLNAVGRPHCPICCKEIVHEFYRLDVQGRRWCKACGDAHDEIDWDEWHERRQERRVWPTAEALRAPKEDVQNG